MVRQIAKILLMNLTVKFWRLTQVIISFYLLHCQSPLKVDILMFFALFIFTLLILLILLEEIMK